MTDTILNLNIIDGALIHAVIVLSVALAIYLLVRRPTRKWVLIALTGILSGALIAVFTVMLTINVWNVFGVGLSTTSVLVIVFTFAAIGLAVVSMWRARWWRRMIAGGAIVVFAVTGVLGVNASIGLLTTLGALIDISTAQPLALPPAAPTPRPTATVGPVSAPLYTAWSPPEDMPPLGSLGTIDIPNTNSGFAARPALAYLPPAALVPNAPQLPVVIQLMGSPGSPDLTATAAILNDLAAKNGGLAPIVINPDQLGDPTKDPLCLDVTSDKAETYIMKDVVPYVRSHFNVLSDPKDWSFVGFSNGGECATYFAAKYPDTFGNVVDISGDQYPAYGDNGAVRNYFRGNKASYEATWPVNIMAKTAYPDTFAVFTAGGDDTEIKTGVQTVYNAAIKAGWKSSFTEIPNAGHDGPALQTGLKTGYDALYPRLNLSPPPG
ncbi:alpha/beta hydrolase-fold protein [Subtercola frigoramans]|uniref:Enterochelin esterase-like enzyme n=1 Tax=Subtercola frigoramans TaxID=120298 RepID=A0ABS2L0L7_9MICO|nr:alpha/beta hydrolase-fold protein [Subtercola frigoramans]MBM7470589.1 enterochelin esterase-like enzyme [Subtercola frigoramans]